MTEPDRTNHTGPAATSNRAAIAADADRLRLVGISRGTLAWVGAWIVGAAIARLTGAAAVLLVLAGTLVAFLAAFISAVKGARSLGVRTLSITPVTSVDTPTSLVLGIEGPVQRIEGVIEIRFGSELLATCRFDQLDGDTAHLDVVFPHGGVVDAVTVDLVSPGASGAMWIRRRLDVQIEPIDVAPRLIEPGVDIDEANSNQDGASVASHGPKHGDVDGIRLWRSGDGDTAVHWPSTLRSGALIVHDRQTSLDRTWVVTAPSSPVDEHLAGRLAHTMLEGLRLGHEVVLRRAASTGPEPDGLDPTGTDTKITSSDHVKLHSARLIGPARLPTHDRQSIFRRPMHVRATADTVSTLTATARWLTALASLVSLGMLIGALGFSTSIIGLGIGGVVAGTLVSLWASRGETKPAWLSASVTLATIGSLAAIASSVGGVDGLLEALRGPMPELLMLLLVIHGFEVVDRRALRVHQAITGVIVTYAAGLRIDDRVGLWLAAWATVIVLAVRATTRRRPGFTTRPTVAPTSTSLRRIGGPVVALVGAALATVAILLAIPVPDGPARLGLPALSNDAPSTPGPGALAGPDGGAPAASDGTRGSLGQVGGYPGFAESLDTSVRGDLGNEIVMRVRAPQPDFWRGQTFSEFDGRRWTASPELGERQDGPRIVVPPALGDLPRPGIKIDTDELIQTYYVEADLPNVVFAAARPDLVTFDGSVWTRPDGALRADVTLTKGSVYTVVSQRSVVTADLLRAQGDISVDFAAVTDRRGRSLIDPFLAVPESTTQRTIDLATRLRTPGESTYDTIQAYQSWIAQNTQYDLDAPVPAQGADAVDDFLFVSQRGFCEQIASALTIMLRSQGIPARLATGYIPGVRDKVSGVFEVRASDAHAWVEVWFPDSGWQAFDPTADVPLSGETDRGSVGADLVSAVFSTIASRPIEIAMMVGVGISLLGLYRWVLERLRRHRRGRWGVLQDEFTSITSSTSVPSSTPSASITSSAAITSGGAVTNPQRAASFDDESLRAHAEELTAILDGSEFDPNWKDTDESFRRARFLLSELRRASRRRAHIGEVPADERVDVPV